MSRSKPSCSATFRTVGSISSYGSPVKNNTITLIRQEQHALTVSGTFVVRNDVEVPALYFHVVNVAKLFHNFLRVQSLSTKPWVVYIRALPKQCCENTVHHHMRKTRKLESPIQVTHDQVTPRQEYPHFLRPSQAHHRARNRSNPPTPPPFARNPTSRVDYYHLLHHSI